MSQMLSPREAASKLGVGLPRLYSLLHSSKLRGTKRGNAWVISEQAIKERIAYLKIYYRRKA